MVTEHPWEALPPEVADVLRPELPALADEIVAELSRGVPDYARPLEGPFGQALRTGVEEALGRFTTIIGNPGADADAGREVYVNLGRGEMRAGRSLDALLAAYRLGARVAWRRLAAAGERAGLSPRTLYTLAEAIFAYIDELSADSIEGYAREQAAAAGALQRRRQCVAALLAQDPAPAPATVEAAASDADWRLPRSLAALVVEAEGERSAGGLAPGEQADRLALRLGPEALVAHVAPYIVALVPAPAERRELERAVRGRPAALGPQVPWQESAVSFARAREVLRLAEEGGIDAGDALLMAESHKLSLLLGADRRLARDVAEAALEPLAAETELSRERLGSTLDAWLRHRGRTEAVARALHVHPQTVRYRLARLRELFGTRLDDPDGRFELELALRARRIAG
jgi:PucR C-terminal helix-turn-helix domain